MRSTTDPRNSEEARAVLSKILLLLVSTAFTIVHAEAADASKPIADFRLKDIHRRPRSLADYEDKKAFVVVFLDTECPLANLYVPTLLELNREYAEKGVQFVAINSSQQDSFTSVSAHAQEREIPFPVLKDFDQKVADEFGAK